MIPPQPTTDGGDRGLDKVLSALSSRRARFVCYYVGADDVSGVNELFLAREVAAWETGTDPARVPTEKVTQILDELQKGTLPDLDEAGMITYDRGTGTVRYGNPPDPYARLLGICQSIEQPGD